MPGRKPPSGWSLSRRGRSPSIIAARSASAPDDACSNLDCGYRACWIEEAHVTELTGLLREGPDGDRLKAWPTAMRGCAAGARPRPVAQLTLLEAREGGRFSLWETNLPADTRGWRGQCAYIDA